MKHMKSILTAALLATGFTTLTACGTGGLGVSVPITPYTVAGCWEGESARETIDARIHIRPDREADEFLIDGKFSGLINHDFDDYKVTYSDDELKPRDESRWFPSKLRVDDNRLILTTVVPPTSFNLKRCAL